MAEPTPSQTLRFATFEVDLRSGELRKNGTKIKLQEKPFRILALLLERRGALITREELRERLWPADTFVDFDHSLGTAVAKLRQALGDSAQNPRFVETLSNRGYRFLAPLENIVPTPSRAVRRASQIRRFSFSAAAGLFGGALLLVVFLGFDIDGARQWLRRRSNPSIRSLAVLPLENLSGDPQQEYFTDGMTDELITNLAQLGNVHVISRTSVMQYKGTRKPLPQIARELHVDALVEGSVMRSGQRVRIVAQLVDAGNDQHLWAQSYDRDVGDVLVLQGEISRTIAEEIRITLTPQQRTQLGKNPGVDPQVEEDYLKGRYHLNKGSEKEIRKAIQFFEHVLATNPRDARGYAGLADSYVALSDYYVAPSEILPKAKSASLKALELDDKLAEAHTSSGVVRFLYDWDWPGAEKEFKRAIELNPSSADAHVWYGVFLAQMERGREAIAELKRSEALDPLSLSVHMNAGWVYYLLRQNEKAIEQWGTALDLEPQFAVSHSAIWVGYLRSPDFARLMAALGRGSSGDDPMELAALGGLYAVSGDTARARAVLFKLRAMSRQRYVCPYEMATTHAILGDKDEAIAYLRRGYEEHSACIPDIKTDPRLDALRADPRFQELLMKVGFGP
jgi:TolB-like protein/DNA-binding winged helix-turn-helix (wHTH) protein/tetratricopeptide (TPR) repeat protein